jgi:hypothetical protein
MRANYKAIFRSRLHFWASIMKHIPRNHWDMNWIQLLPSLAVWAIFPAANDIVIRAVDREK